MCCDRLTTLFDATAVRICSATRERTGNAVTLGRITANSSPSYRAAVDGVPPRDSSPDGPCQQDQDLIPHAVTVEVVELLEVVDPIISRHTGWAGRAPPADAASCRGGIEPAPVEQAGQASVTAS